MKPAPMKRATGGRCPNGNPQDASRSEDARLSVTSTTSKTAKERAPHSVSDIVALVAVMVTKATLPFSVGFILLRQWRKWRTGKLRGLGDVLRLGIRHFLRTWLTIEAYFYMHYRYQQWRLSEVDIQVPPLRRRDGLSQDRRREYLERCLNALDEVCSWQITRGGGGSTSSERHSGGAMHCDVKHDDGPLLTMQDGMTNVLTHARVRSADAFLHRVSSLKGGFAASAEDLVRLGGDEGNFATFGTDEETLRLSMRRAELSGWFFYAPAERITRGNVAEWLTEYFFSGTSLDNIRQDSMLSQELNGLVQRIVEWAHLDPDSSEIPNPEVRCMRLTRDPLPSGHLPFWLYFGTNIILPHITRAKLTQLGFRRYRAGAMVYWFRRAGRKRGRASSDQGLRHSGALGVPLVFCHGLGVGVLPYVQFVACLCDSLPDTDIFCVDLPHIQMRPREEVPSAREMCACMGDMLEAWGYSSAHFVGHSFGTLVCAWALRYMTSTVASVSLLDPICLLLCKSDLIYNALYAWKWRNPFEDLPAWILSLIVFRELYICHTLSRNFFWNQNQLWPEDLSQVPSLVVLSGRDRLVPAHTVKCFLEATIERQRRGNSRKLWASIEAQSMNGDAWRCSKADDCPQEGLLQPPVCSRSSSPPPDETCFIEPKVRFFLDAVHGQFWADATLMKEVLREVVSLVQSSGRTRSSSSTDQSASS